MKILKLTDLHRGYDHRTHIIHRKFFEKIQNNEEFDVVLVTGDLISSQQKQMKSMLKALRRSFPTKPILIVKGNHDYWDKHSYLTGKARRRGGKITLGEMFTLHDELCEEFNIFYLENAGWRYTKNGENVLFLGYDGWYKYINPEVLKTNDQKYMPRYHELAPVHSYMNYRAHQSFGKLLERAREEKKTNPETKLVCLTHFNLVITNPDFTFMAGDPRHLEFMQEIFDLVLFGHTHRPYDEMHGDCRVINAGTDITQSKYGYNCPRYVIIDI